MLLTFYILLIVHFVADFILQGPVISVKKKRLNKYMLAHGAIMGLAFFLPLINYPAGKVVMGGLAVFASHILIDALRIEVNGLFKLDSGKYLFWAIQGIDQALHVSVLFLLFNFLIV